MKRSIIVYSAVATTRDGTPKVPEKFLIGVRRVNGASLPRLEASPHDLLTGSEVRIFQKLNCGYAATLERMFSGDEYAEAVLFAQEILKERLSPTNTPDNRSGDPSTPAPTPLTAPDTDFGLEAFLQKQKEKQEVAEKIRQRYGDEPVSVLGVRLVKLQARLDNLKKIYADRRANAERTLQQIDEKYGALISRAEEKLSSLR
jgi:hypothetical protein